MQCIEEIDFYAKYELAYPVFPGWPPLGTGVASVQILVRARDSSRTSHEGQKRPVFASVSTRIRKLRAATFGVRIGFHKDTQVQILCRNKYTQYLLMTPNSRPSEKASVCSTGASSSPHGPTNETNQPLSSQNLVRALQLPTTGEKF